MNDREAASLVATRLRALAREMAMNPISQDRRVTLIEGFLGAACAVESSRPSIPQRQLHALLQILTAGHATLSCQQPPVPSQLANDNG